MKTNSKKPQPVKKDELGAGNTKENPKAIQQDGKAGGKKRKHVSALVAASMGRSAVSQTQARSFDEAGYNYTGTNDTFTEE